MTATCVDIGGLLAPPPWATMPVIRHGCGGERSHVVCGYLQSDDPLFDPAMAAMHREPERRWTVADLAAVAAVSPVGARRAVGDALL